MLTRLEKNYTKGKGDFFLLFQVFVFIFIVCAVLCRPVLSLSYIPKKKKRSIYVRTCIDAASGLFFLNGAYGPLGIYLQLACSHLTDRLFRSFFPRERA